MKDGLEFDAIRKNELSLICSPNCGNFLPSVRGTRHESDFQDEKLWMVFDGWGIYISPPFLFKIFLDGNGLRMV